MMMNSLVQRPQEISECQCVSVGNANEVFVAIDLRCGSLVVQT